MAIKGTKTTQIANDTNVSQVKFNFKSYDAAHAPFKNNGTDIDFVTWNGNLYVCVQNNVGYQNGDPSDNGFLLLVAKGEDGQRGIDGQQGPVGPMPQLTFRFNGKQLEIRDNGTRVAVSPDLTGPAWKPVRSGDTLTWELSRDGSRPADIDLNDLRDTEEHPLLLRTNSDNTKTDDEDSGPANFIQWKREGDAEWHQLISISELLNLALAGVSIWADPETHKWHFGHKEVINATYSTTPDGRKQIIQSNVELGEILFDAGELPFANYEVDFSEVEGRLDALEDALANINPTQDLSQYLTKALGDLYYVAKGPDYLTPDRFKTINHQSIVGTGNIDITGGSSIVDTEGLVRSVNNIAPVEGNVTIDLGILTLTLQDGVLKYTNKNGETVLGYVGGLTEREISILILNAFRNYNWADLFRNQIGDLPDFDTFVTRSDLSAYATETWVLAKLREITTGVDYYRPFTLYTRHSSGTTAPNPPDSIDDNFIWDTATEEVLIPVFASNWSNHPTEATNENPYLWMATAVFSYYTKKAVKGENATSAWTLACLTAEPGTDGTNGIDGTDGADADGTEFAYILCTAEEYADPTFKNNRPVKEHNDNRDDNLPVSIFSNDHPAWTDHPSGISPEWPIEVVSIRRQSNGTWGEYSYPTIWSMWAEDGVDGDGVEYIYCVAGEDAVYHEDGKVKLSSAKTNTLPTTQERVNQEQWYQIRDWVPDGSTRTITVNGEQQTIYMPQGTWTDNPLDIDETQPYEFVSIRKFNHETQLWGPFCDPVLWSRWAQASTIINNNNYVTQGTIHRRPYTCYAFTRNNTDLAHYSVLYDLSAFATELIPNPTFGDLTIAQMNAFYDNPLDYIKTLDNRNQPAQGIIWYDTIPSEGGKVWMIQNHIGDEGGRETGWDGPFHWADDFDFQVEYSNSESASRALTNPSLLPNIGSNNNRYIDANGDFNEAVWRQDVLNAGLGEWHDTVENPVYMATAKKNANGWTNWSVAKIKGEKGDKGDSIKGDPGEDGNGVEFVFFALTPEQYANRTNFVGIGNNLIYVYDDDTYELKTFEDNEYLPYILLYEGNGTIKVRALDSNPGITEEKPYVFACSRSQTNGMWVRKHLIPPRANVPESSSTFNPAGLWLAGDVIDYAGAVVDITDEMLQVLVDADTSAVLNRTRSSSYADVSFYHGLMALSLGRIEVYNGSTWQVASTVYSTSVGFSSISEQIEIPNVGFFKITPRISEYNEPRYIDFSITFIDNFKLREKLAIPIRFVSTNSFINESGVETRYVAETYIYFNPVVGTESLRLIESGRDQTLKKDNIDDTTINGQQQWYYIARGSGLGVASPDVIPGDPSKWYVSISLDGVENKRFYFALDYNDWYQNIRNIGHGEDYAYSTYYNESGETINSNGDYYLEIRKDLDSSDHYVNGPDYIWLMFRPSFSGLDLRDNITVSLYYDNTLMDEEITYIIYPGRDGLSVELENAATPAPVVSMAMTPNGISVTTEENETQTLNLSVAQSVAQSISQNSGMLNWWSESEYVSNNQSGIADSLGSIAGIKKSSDLIKTTLQDNILSIDLDFDLLVQRVIERLGGAPVIEPVSVTYNNEDYTGRELPGGVLVIISGHDLQGIANLYSDTTYSAPAQALIGIGTEVTGYTGYTKAGEDVEVTTNTGLVVIKVEPAGGGVTPGVPVPVVTTAEKLLIGKDVITNGLESDDEDYITLKPELTCDPSLLVGSTLTHTIHLSKPMDVYSVGSTVTQPGETMQRTDTIELADGETVVLYYGNRTPGIIVGAYAIGTLDDGQDETTYTSRTTFITLGKVSSEMGQLPNIYDNSPAIISENTTSNPGENVPNPNNG